jgi:hypothetical protein
MVRGRTVDACVRADVSAAMSGVPTNTIGPVPSVPCVLAGNAHVTTARSYPHGRGWPPICRAGALPTAPLISSDLTTKATKATKATKGTRRVAQQAWVDTRSNRPCGLDEMADHGLTVSMPSLLPDPLANGIRARVLDRTLCCVVRRVASLECVRRQSVIDTP